MIFIIKVQTQTMSGNNAFKISTIPIGSGSAFAENWLY